MLSLRTFPIETRRLGLRPWGPDEYPILRAILSDLETMRHWPAPLTEDTLRGWHARAMSLWKERHLGRMAVVLKETDAVIGDAGLNPTEIAGRAVTDLGYIVHADHHGRGFGSELARALLDHGSARGLPDIVCHMAEDHTASRRVAEKIGMVPTGRFVNPKNAGKTHLVFEPPPRNG
jgi:ribosomal-protein-alanine N-acetyltransferase